MKPPPKLFICAGEASGDLHGSALIQSLHALDSNITLHGVAGPLMVEAGCETLHGMDELNVMGIGDVIKALPRIRRVEASLCEWAEKNRPDLAILVDFPGFNMRLGRKLREMGIPVVQYIAPKLWAWGAWRVKKLKASQDILASILPFEVEWFARHGIEATYVGNPSAVSCARGWSREELRSRLGLNDNDFLLALLPGSRPGELARHAELLAEAGRKIVAGYPQVKLVTTQAPGVSDEQLKPLLDADITVIDRMEEGYAMRADAAVAVSGTATLELALWDTPTVLVYRNSPMMVWLARKLVSLDCAGLANILLGDIPVMPELIQEFATVENIANELESIISGDAAMKQRQKFVELKAILTDKNPSEELAKIIIERLNRPS